MRVSSGRKEKWQITEVVLEYIVLYWSNFVNLLQLITLYSTPRVHTFVKKFCVMMLNFVVKNDKFKASLSKKFH